MASIILSAHLERTLRPVGVGSLFNIPNPPGYGPTRNLHLLMDERLKGWNAFLELKGGLNPHRKAMYRLVWGWQRPDLYGIGDSTDLEFFHLERWVPMVVYDEEEWDERELSCAKQNPRYRIQPFPRHGEYILIATCRWGLGPVGQRKAYFRVPDDRWLMGRLEIDFERRERTKAEVAEQVKDTMEAQRQLEIERNNRISDDLGLRDLVETETHMLLRNPTLRKEQSLMLAPN